VLVTFRVDVLVLVKVLTPVTPSCVVVTMKRLLVPATLRDDPITDVPVMFDAMRFEETMLARFEVPLTFSEVPDMDVPEMFDAMRFAETIFARLLVPDIFSEVPI
jgi:hypothetical protein